MKSRLLAVCMLLVACGTPKTPAELEAGLNDPDPKVRRNSADGLRDGGDVPPDAVPKLLAAIANEKEPEVIGAELITLGASGVAEAKPIICKYVGGGPNGDVRMSRWASHAQTAWLKKNPMEKGCSGVSTVPEVPVNAPSAAPAAAPNGDTRSM